MPYADVSTASATSPSPLSEMHCRWPLKTAHRECSVVYKSMFNLLAYLLTQPILHYSTSR